MFEHAKWIGFEEDYNGVCPEFRKGFSCRGEIEKAVLSITAIGVYEAYINEQRVGEFVLAPGCTVFRERLQYQSYDVTALLAEQNELRVGVGAGWHRGRISKSSQDINQMPCALIASLQITYEDGSTNAIESDGSWQVRKSRVLFSDLYDGEIYDACRAEEQYSQVKVYGEQELSRERLIPQEGEEIREQEQFKPAAYFVTPKGERVIDFGQNMAGYVTFTVSAGKGDRVVLSHGEILDRDGNFYTENYRTAQAKLTYICREGEQSYKPRFAFWGFRYIRLDEWPGEADPGSFTAVAVYSHMARTGYIESGNEKINRLYSNTLWSQRSNFIDIPTDCPQRDERMGWTGDAQVFAKAAGYHYHVNRFFRKWMRDLRAEQYEDGMVPDVVPNFWKMRRGSAAWGDAVTIIPWQMYLFYGDRDMLEENFDAMRRWVDYVAADTQDKDLWTCKSEEKKLWGKHYGDWLAQDAPYGSYIGATEVDLVATAFHARSVELLVKAGKVLGKDVSEYEALHQRIVKAFRKAFPKLETQTAHVLALTFGLTDNREQVADSLAEMVRSNGNRLQTGFTGTPYLLYALSDNGHVDTAYELLFQEELPSWLYEVNHGATTIWEHWDGVRDDGTAWSSDMNSYNHYSYGCVMDWIYSVAAGIRTVEEAPGFEKVCICPHPDRRMGHLCASLNTGRGVIRSAWRYVGEQARYEISTPVEACIVIEGKEYQVTKGEYVFYGERRTGRK